MFIYKEWEIISMGNLTLSMYSSDSINSELVSNSFFAVPCIDWIHKPHKRDTFMIIIIFYIISQLIKFNRHACQINSPMYHSDSTKRDLNYLIWNKVSNRSKSMSNRNNMNRYYILVIPNKIYEAFSER